jgi:ligand-binding SRPBCC domain-containing protein
LKTYRLTRSQLLPVGIDEAFSFFADARNLERLTPPWLHFEIVTPSSIEMAPGTLIDYKLRLHGVPVRWRSEILTLQPPHGFVDRQVRGPYRSWVHRHTFEAVAEGTLVTDTVDYNVPGGRLVERYFVRPDLERIFAYRAGALEGWASLTLEQEKGEIGLAEAR